jgi:dihydroorotate dehydrogenase
MNLYKLIIRRALFILNPEAAHHLTFNMLIFFKPFLRLFVRRQKRSFPGIEMLGLPFEHPIGLAAGLDKDGRAYKSLSKLGFSFIELGTVTPKAQPGNLKPRLFRLRSDKALINRMGFNNLGVDELAKRLKNRPEGMIIGGNIGKNTNTPNHLAKLDYLYCFKALHGLVDYFVVNVSCPNIADLKDLQDKDNLLEILLMLMDYRSSIKSSVPVLLKVSPDLNEFQLLDLIEVVKTTKIDGLIATNTTITRHGISLSKEEIEKIGKGGLSGAPLHKRSLEVIRTLRDHLPEPYPIIASGGILNENDAKQSLEAGAQLIQLYTGFIYEGPKIINKILKSIS